jgi:hypothetical protein
MMLTDPAPVISRPLAGRCGQCLGLHGVLSRPVGEPTEFRLGRDNDPAAGRLRHEAGGSARRRPVSVREAGISQAMAGQIDPDGP